MSTLLEMAENVRGLNGQVIIFEDSDVFWTKPKHVDRAQQALLKRFVNVAFKRKLPNSGNYEVWDIHGNAHYEVVVSMSPSINGNNRTYNHIVFPGHDDAEVDVSSGGLLDPKMRLYFNSEIITTECCHPNISKP
jgi:hypothetical protein